MVRIVANINSGFMEEFFLRKGFNRIRYSSFFERTDLEELTNEVKNVMHFKVVGFVWLSLGKNVRKFRNCPRTLVSM